MPCLGQEGASFQRGWPKSAIPWGSIQVDRFLKNGMETSGKTCFSLFFPLAGTGWHQWCYLEPAGWKEDLCHQASVHSFEAPSITPS